MFYLTEELQSKNESFFSKSKFRGSSFEMKEPNGIASFEQKIQLVSETLDSTLQKLLLDGWLRYISLWQQQLFQWS